MNELDFSGKGVLVVGGSSGIGNGIAHAFLERGAAVHVWGTRARAEDYDGVEGSDLNGLAYGQVDFSEGPAQLWAETATSASEHVAEAQLKLISIAQRKNSRIAWVVLLSGIAELLALVMLAVAVILILR